MSEWVKVVTDQLGLAGFALFLVFGALAALKHRGERKWFAGGALAAAFVALAGGLFLGYTRSAQSSHVASGVSVDAKSPPGTPAVAAPASVKETHGAGSPIIENVGRDVTLTIDQSAHGTAAAGSATK